MAYMSGAGGQWGQRADPRPGEPRGRGYVPVLNILYIQYSTHSTHSTNCTLGMYQCSLAVGTYKEELVHNLEVGTVKFREVPFDSSKI